MLQYFVFSLKLRPPPIPTLFPYTTLFRSGPDRQRHSRQLRHRVHSLQPERRRDAQPRSRADDPRYTHFAADLLVGHDGELGGVGKHRDAPAQRHPGIVRVRYLALWERPQWDAGRPVHDVAHRILLSAE